MHLGYNTNGLAHHDLLEAVRLLADLGYQSVAVTIDHGALAPADERLPRQLSELRRLLERSKMRSVIETGARYLLDPRRKHEPTLVSPEPDGRLRRIAFYQHAIDCAAKLGSDCVSLWSGAVHDAASREETMDRLVTGLRQILDYAARRGMTIAFEPEPGMLIDSMEAYATLLDRINADHFRLTLDIGHLHCQGEVPEADVIRRWSSRLANVHIEDMRAGVHQHLMFGEGEIDFPPILQALAATGYTGGMHVELNRHSHVAPAAAQRARDFLLPLMERLTLNNE